MKVTHLIKTKSLDSDGRLLKWIQSLSSHGVDSDVFILADKNIKKTYVANEANIYSISLYFRRYFGKSKGIILKVLEFTYKELKYVMRSSEKIFIFHDVQHYLGLFCLCLFKTFHNKKLIWDLHELPHTLFTKSFLLKYFIRFILKRVDLVIYTNGERRDYIRREFKVNEKRHLILNNYPNLHYINNPKHVLPSDLSDWLQGTPYVLWMGMATVSRNFLSVLDALSEYKQNIKLVIMGSIAPDVQMQVDNLQLNDFIFSKFVSQNEIPQYVDNALFSIVFYKNTSPNNYYCEPNRLYQLMTRHIPVIVGGNPPMKNFVLKHGGGIVLDDDGSDRTKIKHAIDKMMNPTILKMYQANLQNSNFSSHTWDEQFKEVIHQIKTI